MTSTHKKHLTELEKIDRRSLIYGSLVGAASLGVFAFLFYILYVPGPSREVRGVIVSFTVTARETSPGVTRRVYVRLDDGRTVGARIDGHIAVKIGKRAVLRATKMRVIGVERFRFLNFED